MVLLYSAVLSADRPDYPVHSVYTIATGHESISTGLSRSFSEIVRLHLREAHEYNHYGIRIFLFFAVQLIFRLNFFMTAWGRTPGSRLITMDIILSAGVFLVAFWPFLVHAAKAILVSFPHFMML